MIRVGLVDFDTSHVVAFTQRLNHVGVGPEDWVDGAQVVAGCPGSSDIMPERIPGYVAQLRDYGIELVERPEELIGRIDAVMIESQQGSRHLDRARPFLEAGLPTFVDKPFAATVEEVDAMVGLAQEHGAPLMSCSALRYDPQIAQALEDRSQHGSVVSAYAWTPASLHEGNPGLLHYGIHGVEMLYALLGQGCQEVQALSSPAEDLVIGRWGPGRVGTVYGMRAGQYGLGFVAHYERANRAAQVEGAAFYREMLKQIVRMFETGEPPIEAAEMREIIAFCGAALESGRAGGRAVGL